MKNVTCSHCGIRVQIPARAAAFVGSTTICPQCLINRPAARRTIKQADQPDNKAKRWAWIKRPWQRLRGHGNHSGD